LDRGAHAAPARLGPQGPARPALGAARQLGRDRPTEKLPGPRVTGPRRTFRHALYGRDWQGGCRAKMAGRPGLDCTPETRAGYLGPRPAIAFGAGVRTTFRPSPSPILHRLGPTPGHYPGLARMDRLRPPPGVCPGRGPSDGRSCIGPGAAAPKAVLARWRHARAGGWSWAVCCSSHRADARAQGRASHGNRRTCCPDPFLYQKQGKFRRGSTLGPWAGRAGGLPRRVPVLLFRSKPAASPAKGTPFVPTQDGARPSRARGPTDGRGKAPMNPRTHQGNSAGLAPLLPGSWLCWVFGCGFRKACFVMTDPPLARLDVYRTWPGLCARTPVQP